MRPDAGSQWLGMSVVPAACFVQDRRGVVAGMIVQGEDKITVNITGLRLEPKRRTVGKDRILEPALVLEDVAEPLVRFRIVRLEPQCHAVGGDGVFEATPLIEDIAEV